MTEPVVRAAAERLLILGGGGMVGLQVAREAARELRPAEIILSGLTDAEVSEAVTTLAAEGAQHGWNVRFSGAPGDIFLPVSLQGKARQELIADSALFDQLFDDIFTSDPDAWKNSALVRLIEEHRPDVVVDCINTATAISYQDVYTTSRKVKVLLDRLEAGQSLASAEIAPFVHSVRELLIAQGVPQIVRHILFLHQALRESDVRVYLKVGTTGTGGMGMNIPYTHSEDKPSATLLSKSAIGFAHTGLLFLLARTPGSGGASTGSHGAIVKEIKPGAMIGFKRLGLSHVKVTGPSGRREPGYLVEPREERLGDDLQPLSDSADYRDFEGRRVPLRMVGADTGENGFFSIGEFQAITYPRQMEYVTPEEVAKVVVLEILGSSTGRDVLSAIDGAITEPSYRAGVLREHACREMLRLEALMAAGTDDVVPSIAVGHLGPPRLSKLLIEAFLLREATGSSTLEALLVIRPEEMLENVERYLASNPRIASLIATIGIPVLRDPGALTITRGPRLNIPVASPDGRAVALDRDSIERFGHAGWVDLRGGNFEIWSDRIRRLAESRPDIAAHGSASFDPSRYMSDLFIPGDVVGWILTNEVDEMGLVGHRLY